MKEQSLQEYLLESWDAAGGLNVMSIRRLFQAVVPAILNAHSPNFSHVCVFS